MSDRGPRGAARRRTRRAAALAPLCALFPACHAWVPTVAVPDLPPIPPPPFEVPAPPAIPDDPLSVAAAPSRCRPSARVPRGAERRTEVAALDQGIWPAVREDPEYPSSAAERCLSGWVAVRFGISAKGDVQDPRVLASDPSKLFEAATLSALRSWKYAPARTPELLPASDCAVFLYQHPASPLDLAEIARALSPAFDCLRKPAVDLLEASAT